MKYFGTDGIRMKAEEFDTGFLAAVVKGVVDYAGENAKVLIGGDTRESTEWLLRDLEMVLETFGLEYGNVGVLPTPALHYCFPRMGFSIAIDVTASHNPYTDNGVKIFEAGEQGSQKLSKRGCEMVEKALEERPSYSEIAPSLRESLHQDAVEIYCEHLLEYVGEADFGGLKIGIDCANGAMSVIGGQIFEQLGAEVEVINADASYGRKINDGCGSTHLEQLATLVKDKGLDFGVAFDGDGDRCLMVDHEGKMVDGDPILAILVKYFGLKTVAFTVMANQGLLNWAQKEGLIYEVTPVGDSEVLAAMQAKNLEIGGEQSGHVILPGQKTGDGMLTALMVTKAVAESGKSLRELADVVEILPQVMVNMKASDKQKAAFKNGMADKLVQRYEEKLQEVSGRLLVRPSGTERLIRVTMWGDDAEKIEKWAKELSHKMKEVL